MSKGGISDGRYLKAVEVLRTARKAARLSQTDVATKLGRSQQFVSKYESGERRLDFIEFLDVATTLNLDWASLLRTVEQPELGGTRRRTWETS